MLNILGFVSHMASFATTQFCSCSMNTQQTIVNKCSWLCSNKTLFTKIQDLTCRSQLAEWWPTPMNGSQLHCKQTSLTMLKNSEGWLLPKASAVGKASQEILMKQNLGTPGLESCYSNYAPHTGNNHATRNLI